MEIFCPRVRSTLCHNRAGNRVCTCLPAYVNVAATRLEYIVSDREKETDRRREKDRRGGKPEANGKLGRCVGYYNDLRVLLLLRPGLSFRVLQYRRHKHFTMNKLICTQSWLCVFVCCVLVVDTF